MNVNSPPPLREIIDTPENFKRLLLLVNEYSKSLLMCSKLLKAVEALGPEQLGFLLHQTVKEFSNEHELMAAYKEKILQLNTWSNLEH